MRSSGSGGFCLLTAAVCYCWLAAFCYGDGNALILGETAAQNPLIRVRRIVGEATRVSDFEKVQNFGSAVSLVTTFVGTGRFTRRIRSCAATIVSNSHVITAAHCVADKTGRVLPGSKWRLHMFGVKRTAGVLNRVGGWFTKKFIQMNKLVGNEVEADSALHAHGRMAFVHPNYSRGEYLTNDLAVMRTSIMLLDNYLMFNKVELPPDEVVSSGGPHPGETCEFAGWGCLRHGGSVQKFLMKTNFTIMPLERCTRTYTRRPHLWSGMLCAQTLNTSLCSGDSGSGLICQHRGTRYLAGVASSGADGTLGHTHPSNFVKVGAHMEWISEAMEVKDPKRRRLRLGKLEIEMPKWIG